MLRRLALTLAFLTLLSAAGYAAVRGDLLTELREERAAGSGPAAGAGGTPAAAPTATPDGRSTPEPSDDSPSDPTPQPTTPADPSPRPGPTHGPTAGPALMAEGARGPDVRDLQARLRQIDWFDHDVTGYYGEVTAAAVEGFQAKREIAVTGAVDQETLDRLLAMTTEPSAAELANQLANQSGGNIPGRLDPRCSTGHVLCVDKTSRTLRWVVDGRVLSTVDVRFGSEYTPTREGAFQVNYKSRDHVSSLYGSAMPYAMFFSGGQAVHYSSDFAAVGYNGASHGCVNVRDFEAIAHLFDQVEVGDAVIVYRS